jgi:hypothetical protein
LLVAVLPQLLQFAVCQLLLEQQLLRQVLLLLLPVPLLSPWPQMAAETMQTVMLVQLPSWHCCWAHQQQQQGQRQQQLRPAPGTSSPAHLRQQQQQTSLLHSAV